MISVVEAVVENKTGDDGKWILHNEDFHIFDKKMIDDLYLEVAGLFDQYMDAAKLPEGFIEAYAALLFANGFILSGKKVHKGLPQRWNWVALHHICELKDSRRWLKKQLKKMKAGEHEQAK